MNLNININASQKANIDVNTLLVLYKHYKEFFLPVGVIFVSILLFFFIVIPQVQNYFTLQDQTKIEKQKLAALKNNLNLLSTIDETELDKDLSVVSSTLPTGKDFAGVINAISTDALLTGVSLGDFEFLVGDLSKSSVGVSSFPSLQITVDLNGNITSIVNYISNIYKTAPLGEVTTIKTSANNAALTMFFYYKPFSSSSLSSDSPVVPISQKGQRLIAEIAGWHNVSGGSLSSGALIPSASLSVPSSQSAGTNPSPF